MALSFVGVHGGLVGENGSALRCQLLVRSRKRLSRAPSTKLLRVRVKNLIYSTVRD